jgi:tetraacyldisaccharide 4'-kinase
MLAMAGQRVLAFAGIGRPPKFFATLEQAGVVLAHTAAFADHHVYRASELAGLRALAAAQRAALVTTTKDYARVALADRAGVIAARISLQWDDPDAIESLLNSVSPVNDVS